MRPPGQPVVRRKPGATSGSTSGAEEARCDLRVNQWCGGSQVRPPGQPVVRGEARCDLRVCRCSGRGPNTRPPRPLDMSQIQLVTVQSDTVH